MKSSKSAVMKASSFYGAGRSRPRIRILTSAKDIVESQESDDLEIVLLPPELANQGIESDEKGSNNILNKEWLLDEVSGEVEIHGKAFEDEITEKESRHSVWRKVMKYEVHSISFQTFFVQAFIIAVNSRYFSMLLLYSL